MSQDQLRGLFIDWDETITWRGMNHYKAKVVSENFDNHPQALIYGHAAAAQIPIQLNPQDNLTEDLKIWAAKVLGDLSHPEEIKIMLELAFAKNIKIAIVTFNQYPDLIFYTLKALGISEEALKSMVVVYGGDGNKNLHIKGAMECLDIQEKGVLFIDDNRTNIKAAEKVGYNCLLADEKKKWIKNVTDRLKHAEEVESSEKAAHISLETIMNINDKFMVSQFELNARPKVVNAPSLEQTEENDGSTEFFKRRGIQFEDDEVDTIKFDFDDELVFEGKRWCNGSLNDVSTLFNVDNNKSVDTTGDSNDEFFTPVHTPPT